MTEKPDPRIDPTSSKFDAKIALRHHKKSVPKGSEEGFKTLAEFEEYILREHPKFADEIRLFAKRCSPGETREESKKEEVQLAKGKKRLGEIQKLLARKRELAILKNEQKYGEPISDDEEESSNRRTERRGDPKSLLEKIAADDFEGPLSLLVKALKEKRKIKVYIRGRERLRNILSAYVVAFDKHWNLALRDVDEIYYRSKKVTVFRKGFHTPEFTKNPVFNEVNTTAISELQVPPDLCYKSLDKHHKRHVETLARHSDQLFVRGDNVILIQIIDPPLSKNK